MRYEGRTIMLGLGKGKRLEGDVRTGLLEEQVDVVEGIGGGKLGDPAHYELSDIGQSFEPSSGIGRKATRAKGLRIEELGLGQHIMQQLHDCQPAHEG